MTSAFDTFGGKQTSAFDTFGFTKPDISSSEALLSLAREHGGAISQVAEELSHPERSILATIGDGFKKAFSSFVDVISLPSEVVAGIISPDRTIKQAIDEDLRPSEVFFGKTDPNASAMSKVGSFFTRTALDILTDPLTYVTFGASQGILGLRAAQKLTVTRGAESFASLIGKDIGSRVALSKPGAALLNKKLTSQISGLTKAYELTGKKAGLVGDELSMFVNKTLNSELRREDAGRAMMRLMVKNPKLMETYLDKGGIKFFGQTIQSSQQIGDALRLIPGMTWIDNITRGTRNTLGSLFDNSFTPSGRIPDEGMAIIQKWKDISESQKSQMFREIPKIWKEFGITGQEDTFLRAAVESGKMPSDPRLAQVWKVLRGYQKKNLKEMWRTGIKVTEVPNYMPHFLVDEPVKKSVFLTPPSTSIKHTKEATIGRFIDVETGIESIGSAEKLGLTPKFREKEIRLISEKLDDVLKTKNIEKEVIEKQITQLSENVTNIFKSKTAAELKAVLKNVPVKDADNAKRFLEVLKDTIDDLDVKKLAGEQAKKTMVAGVKIQKAVDDMSEEGLQLLKARLKRGEAQLPMDIDAVNRALSTAEPKFKVSKAKGGAEGELAELAEKLKAVSKEKKLKLIKEGDVITEVSKGIDKEDMSRFIATLREQFLANPTGAKQILNQIIGKEQKITDILSDIEFEKISTKVRIEDMPEASRFFTDKEGAIFEKIRATVEDAEGIGVNFDKSAITTTVKSSLNIIRGTTMRHMVDELGSKMGIAEEFAPTGYRPVAVKGLKEETIDYSKFLTGSKGQELYFHPETAKRIEEFMGSIINDEATQEVMKKFDKVQSLWKASVTSIFPAFHGRNAISNVFLHFLDIGVHSLNPTNHIMAADMLKKENKAFRLSISMKKSGKAGEEAKDAFHKLMNTDIFTDKSGYSWTFGELRRVISEKNVAFNPNLVGAIDVTRPTSELMEELLPATTKSGIAKRVAKRVIPISTEFLPFKLGRRAGNIVEEQARLLSFMVNLRATGDATMAAQRTKQFLFDYQNLTNFERTFLRRIIPFYAFTRKNIELQAKTLIQAPGRISAEVTALTTLGDVIAGQNLTEEETNVLPDWIKTGIGILRKKKGQTVEILGSLGTPIEQPFQAFQPNQFLGSISPLIRVPVEQMSGYSFFQGKALSDVTNAAAFKSAPKMIQDLIGFTEIKGTRGDGSPFSWYVSLRPERMNLLLNLPPTSRVFSSLKQMQAVDVSTQSKILQQLIGIRPFSFDLEREAAKREKEFQRKLEDLLTKAGITAQFKKTFIPKKD